MKLITGLTSDPNQAQNIILLDGSNVPFSMTYFDNQQGWFFNLSYGSNFSLFNRRLVVSPNMLRTWRNIIPFGLALMTTDGYEPIFITDFISGRASLYILDTDDVQNYENILNSNYELIS